MRMFGLLVNSRLGIVDVSDEKVCNSHALVTEQILLIWNCQNIPPQGELIPK